MKGRPHLAWLVALLVGSSVASTAFGQLPARLAGRPIDEVRVTGETSGATDASDVGIRTGARLSRSLLRRTMQRLLASERWADVQIDALEEGEELVLVVALRPRVVITRIDVVANEHLTDEEVRRALAIPAGGELEQRGLEDLARSVAEAYFVRGYEDAEVQVILRDTDDPSRKVMRVSVEEGRPVRLARFAVDGDEPPVGVSLEGAFDLSPGDVLDRTRLEARLREARQMIRREGYLEARLGIPRIQRQGHEAVITVPARWGPRYTVTIIGHAPLTRTAVEEVLELEAEKLSPDTLQDIEGRVRGLLQRHGYREAEVEAVRLRGPQGGTATLEVRITPGRQLAVVGMSFPGATHFTSTYLRGQVISVLEEGLPDTRMFAPVDSDTADRLGLGGRSVVPARRQLRPPLSVDPSRVYYAPLYEQAVEHLTEIYRAAGYLEARIEAARLEEVGRGRAVVILSVFEGPRTLLFGVSIEGNEVLGDRQLLGSAQLTRGEPFSYLALEEAIERMTREYQEVGHQYARIEPIVRFSENRERAEVVLNVVERFAVRFGDIAIEGNNRTDESLIREVLRFRAGELFRPSRIRESQEALMSLGIFRSVDISPRDPELPEQVKPILISLSERMPQYLDFELGLSTGQGLRGGLEYGYRNLGGYALGVSARVQLGLQFIFQDAVLQQNISGLPVEDRLERRISLTFVLPHVAVPNVSSTLDLTHVRDNQRAFGLDKNGAVLSFNWRPIQPLQVSLSGELEYNGVQLFGDRTSFEEIIEDPMTDQQTRRLLRVPEGESFVVSTRLSASLDQRDSPFVPTRGWFLSAAAEWAHTLELDSTDAEAFFSHFIKLTGSLNGYLPIGDVVFATQLRGGGIVHLEPRSQTYPNRQFFLGGVNSLRGFNQDQLQPQDLAELQLNNPELVTANVLQGGDFFYLLRTELRFPIFGSLYGGVFADLGNHWSNPGAIALSADCTAEPARCFVRPSAGAGLRIATPVGFLALDYGFNLLRRAELREPIGAFHFSIGLF